MCEYEKTQEEEFKDIYAILRNDEEEKDENGELISYFTNPKAQDVFTSRATVKELHTLMESDDILVICNPELVIYLVNDGYPEEQITFFSDDPIKEETFLDEINCTVLPFNKENIMKYQKQFSAGAINPFFDESVRMRRIAESLVKEKLLFICPNADLQDSKTFDNVSYVKNLQDKAFDEKVFTSLLIIDCQKNTDMITVESSDGSKTIKVDNISRLPGDDLDAWMFAEKVLSLKLPSIGKPYISQTIEASKFDEVGEDADGVYVIFQVGYPDKSFRLVKKVSKNHPDLPKVKGFGKHKMVFSRMANPHSRAVAKYAGPEYGTSHNVMAIDYDSKKEVMLAIENYQSDKVLKLIKGSFTGKTNNNQFCDSIPHHIYSDKWDENL